MVLNLSDVVECDVTTFMLKIGNTGILIFVHC